VKIYHASAWRALAEARVGDEFVLHPGPQGAEGRGVYFSEGAPRPSASDSCYLAGVAAIVALEVTSPEGWWRGKAGLARKFGRPRTWHTDGKSIRVRVYAVERGDYPLLRCEWRWEAS